MADHRWRQRPRWDGQVVQQLVCGTDRRNAERQHKKAPDFSPEAMQRLMESEWPGNVRELENIVERAVILSQGGVIGSELVPVHGTGRTVQPRAARTPAVPSDGERPSNTIVPFSEAERRAIGERST